MTALEQLEASQKVIETLRAAGQDTKEAEKKHQELFELFTREAQAAWMKAHLQRMIQ